jgi:adenylate cyclase
MITHLLLPAMRFNPLPRLFLLAAVLVVAAAPLALSGWGQTLEEDHGLTTWFRLRGPRPVPPGVAVVSVDRASAQALGQRERSAQWPRALHAALVDALAAAGARVIVFDLSFAERPGDAEGDKALVAAVRAAGNVVLLDLADQRTTPHQGIRQSQLLLPAPVLAQAAVHGPFLLPKRPLVHAWWLSKPDQPEVKTLPVLAAQVSGLEVGPQVQLRDESRYLDFYGPAQAVPTTSFHRVLEAAREGGAGRRWLRERFADRAVFVGVSAASPVEQDGVRDSYRTAFSRDDGLDLSGVEIAATAYANLAEGRQVRPLPPSRALAVLGVFALLLAAACTLAKGAHAALATFALCVAYLLLGRAAFASGGHWLPLVAPLLLQAPLALLGGLWWQAAAERRERARLDLVIGDLLPAPVVDRLVRRLRHAAPIDRQVYGVFVMSDIQGFTSIAESMSPGEATRLLNDYFELIFPCIERRGGSVSEISGDGILAFWLASGPDRETRLAASLAALDIAALTAPTDTAGPAAALPTRLSVHGGRIVLAQLGAAGHHEYRAVGDAANTASRLEGLSKHLGTRLLASQEAVHGLDELLTRPVGTFLLLGKEAPVCVHELVALRAAATESQLALCEAFAAVVQAWERAQWGEVAELCRRLLQNWPQDGPTRFFLDRASLYATSPPAHGDAVIRMASK